MKTLLGSRRDQSLARLSIFLIMAALIAGMVGCIPLPSEIQDWYDLDAVRNNLDSSYILMNDLDSTTLGYEELASPTANEGKGWEPIGTWWDEPYEPFTGSFDGQDYEITNIFVNRPDDGSVGLFGAVGGPGVIQNVGVTNITVAGLYEVGGLVGWNEGTVNDCYSAGSATGYFYVGGLVGRNDGIVDNSHYNYDEFLINGESLITTGALFSTDFEQWLANCKFLDINERLSQENGYYVVNNVTDFKQLLAFGQDDTLRFRLAKDLDLAGEPNFYVPYLRSEFDGNGYKISNLSLNFNSVSRVGLFGQLASDGTVRDVSAENMRVTAHYYVGGLVGWNEGTVNDSYFSGSVTGDEDVGGLVGRNHYGNVSNSCSNGTVTGREDIGGLVGQTGGRNVHPGVVSDSCSTSIVTGDFNVGGLVGLNGGTVSNSYSNGNVTGGGAVGGLVGTNAGNVSNSYSNGNVIGEMFVGGLVGGNAAVGNVNSSYSTGSVSGDDVIGGLVGVNCDPAGENCGNVTKSFWDTETSGQATSAGGTGRSTAQMQDIATFSGTGWNIVAVNPGERNPSYTWNIVDDENYPFLSWQAV